MNSDHLVFTSFASFCEVSGSANPSWWGAVRQGYCEAVQPNAAGEDAATRLEGCLATVCLGLGEI